LSAVATGLEIQGSGLITNCGGVADDLFESERIEIDVGDGGEESFDEEMIDGRVWGAELSSAMCVLADALGGVDQEILERGGLGIFAADAGIGAAGHAEGLFTLVAKHGFSVSVVMVDVAAGRENPGPTFDVQRFTW
jgi:hypothetical protein